MIVCTIISLGITNSILDANYLSIWHVYVAGLSVEHWVTDGLMAIFFLFIGLELKRELYNGELSDFKNALLPILAAIGGMVTPALIHFVFNYGTSTQAGIGMHEILSYRLERFDASILFPQNGIDGEPGTKTLNTTHLATIRG